MILLFAVWFYDLFEDVSMFVFGISFDRFDVSTRKFPLRRSRKPEGKPVRTEKWLPFFEPPLPVFWPKGGR